MNSYRYIWVDDQLKKCISSAYDEVFLNERWQFAASPKEADAFLYTEYTLSTLNILEVCGVKPLIVFQPRDTRPEFALNALSASDISAILKLIAPVSGKLVELEDVLINTHHDAFYAALVFLWSRGIIFNPLLDTSLPKGYGYLYFDTVLQALNPHIALNGHDIFTYLHDSSLVEATPFEIAHTCPKCEGILLLLRDSCFNCGSPHIYEEILVHHFSCGFQASESHFQVPNEHLLNEFVCPKCKKPLRHFGVDYDKPGVVFHCNDCLHDNGDTEVRLKCLSCGYMDKADNSKKITLQSYKLSARGLQTILSGDSNIFNIKNYFKEHLSLIPFDVFLLVLNKVLSLRSESKHSVLMIHIKNDYLDVSSKKILTELGKALSREIRKGDSISFYQGSLFIMFLETQNNALNELVKKVTDYLSTIFNNDVMGILEFYIVESTTFLSSLREES